MASQYYLYSEVLRHSESPKMLRQDHANQESHAMAESQKSKLLCGLERDGSSLPLVFVDVKIKKERNAEDNSEEGYGYSSADASRLTLLEEDRICLKDNFPDLPKEAEHDIKEERKDIRSPVDDTKTRGEANIFEKNAQLAEGGAESREKEKDLGNPDEKKEKVDVLSYDGEIHETSKKNHWEERFPSKQEHLPSKRKLHELHTEELSLRNDQRTETQRNHPTTHALRYEPQLWLPTKERETPGQNSENRAYSQNMDKHLYADPAFTRMGFLGMPSNHRLANGIGSKFETRTNEQIPRNTAYFSPLDPRDRKFVIPEDPRTRYTPDKEVYRSLCQNGLVHRAWYPHFGAVFTNPTNSEHYFKKGLKRSKEDLRSSPSKERLENHLRLQAGSYWSHYDQSVGRAERRSEDEPFSLENNKAKDYPFTIEQTPEKRTSVEEYCKYVHVPNVLMQTPNSKFFVNGGDLHGQQRIHRNLGYSLPLAEKGSIAFIEKESVCYPCCKEGLHSHYEDMAASARWLDTRHERQRVNPFQTLKPTVVLRENQPQTLLLNEAGARIFRVNNIGNKEQNCQEGGEIPKAVTLPTYGCDLQRETLKKQSSFEDILTAERQRFIDRNRRKQVLDSKDDLLPYSTQNYQTKKILETKANKEKSLAWQEKVYESRTDKEVMDSKMCREIRNEAFPTGVEQKKEAMKAFQDQNNSETQQKIALDQDKQNQEDSSQKKTISCTVCNKSFNRTSNLYTHMRTHSDNKPHACEFCGKRFHQKADLRIHRYIHTGEKPHKCTKCGRGFKQLTHLKYHMRTHSDVRMYKCPYCEKGFNQKSNLQAHIFGHTGQRPHKCETCGKGFTLASTLNTHKRTHLPNKPFKCEFCDRAFYQKNALKMHYVSTHPYSSGACLV